MTCGCLAYGRHGLTAEHRCCICHDAMYTSERNMALPPGAPGWTTLTPCRCAYRSPEKRLSGPDLTFFQERAGIPPAYRQARFAHFDPIPDGAALVKAQQFSQSIGEKGGVSFLVLASRARGNGKTMLACCILCSLWERSETAGRFYVVPELLRRYRASFSTENAETAAQIDQELQTQPLVVLDDLGAEKESEWTRDSLYAIVNYRYNHQLATVITTNQKEAALDGRILSRLQDKRASLWVTLHGPDRRRK